MILSYHLYPYASNEEQWHENNDELCRISVKGSSRRNRVNLVKGLLDYDCRQCLHNGGKATHRRET